MAQEILREIRETEEQAAVLRRVAEEKAAEIRAEVTAEGKAHCEEAQQTTTAEYAEKLKKVRGDAAALVERRRLEAEAQAAELVARARERMDDAAGVIVWGLIEKCQ